METVKVGNSAQLRSGRELENVLLLVIRDFPNPAVAFSGGVDSTVVAYACQKIWGKLATAFIALGPSLSEYELQLARQTAAFIGIEFITIRPQEIENPLYQQNDSQRCFYCKSALYSALQEYMKASPSRQILNGANYSDIGDHRPGMDAADTYGVHSPLLMAKITKSEVRRLAEHWKLPVWDKPASPCLASRIAYGVRVTPAALRRIEQAEDYLRTTFSFQDFRVRDLGNGIAKIEVMPPDFTHIINDRTLPQLVAAFESLGFKQVTLDLAGLRSGKMNDLLVIANIEET